MNIFISWSGKRSQLAAEALADWIPLIFQSVRPWVSSRDIAAGSHWASELSRILEDTQFGILCVTRENLVSPWLLYEAGALSKFLVEGRVIPYLLDLDTSNLVGPLSQFQAVKANKDGTSKLVDAITRSQPQNMRPEKAMVKIFEAMWPELEAKLVKIIKKQKRDLSTKVETHQLNIDVNESSLPQELQDQIESAEASESIGDVWSARDSYAEIVKKAKKLGFDNTAREMERRMRKNISAVASIMRGD